MSPGIKLPVSLAIILRKDKVNTRRTWDKVYYYGGTRARGIVLNTVENVSKG